MKRFIKKWFGLLTAMLSSTVSAHAEQYLLGPQDRVAVRVYDLRRSSSEAYPWTPLNGEFSVGADGGISLPIIGEIPAAGTTTAQIGALISARLKQKADLAELPSASVEVIKYRPFYVVGAVQQPGKYEFIPGLTVLQAVSISQGLLRSDDLVGAKKELSNLKGEAEKLSAENRTLEAKESRLKAESLDADKMLPADFKQDRSLDNVSTSLLIAEQALFESKKSALKSEVAAIDDASDNFRQEIEMLTRKQKSLDTQVEISRKELDLVNELVLKGLTIGSRQVAAEQSQAAYQASRLDAQVALLRAKQNLSRSLRDKIELTAKYKNQSMEDLGIIKAKINENKIRLSTIEKLVGEIAATSLFDNDGAGNRTAYEIVRTEVPLNTINDASENEVLKPGDVLRVRFLRNSEGTGNIESGSNKSGKNLRVRTESER